MVKENAERLLIKAGLRPTSQRIGLAALLFDGCDKHVTAEDLLRLAAVAGVDVSVATVYNTLGQLCAAGLVRRVILDGGRTFFDTNTSPHHHVYFEDDNRLIDVPGESITVSGVPDLGDGAKIKSVEILVRVERA